MMWANIVASESKRVEDDCKYVSQSIIIEGVKFPMVLHRIAIPECYGPILTYALMGKE